MLWNPTPRLERQTNVFASECCTRLPSTRSEGARYCGIIVATLVHARHGAPRRAAGPPLRPRPLALLGLRHAARWIDIESNLIAVLHRGNLVAAAIGLNLDVRVSPLLEGALDLVRGQPRGIGR